MFLDLFAMAADGKSSGRPFIMRALWGRFTASLPRALLAAIPEAPDAPRI